MKARVSAKASGDANDPLESRQSNGDELLV